MGTVLLRLSPPTLPGVQSLPHKLYTWILLSKTSARPWLKLYLLNAQCAFGQLFGQCVVFLFPQLWWADQPCWGSLVIRAQSLSQGNSISSMSSFCLCSQLAGQEATYLSWCGPEPLLDGLAGNSLAAAGAVGLLGLTGLFMARSRWRKCGAIDPSCFRPPQQLQFMILMVCSTQSCLNSYSVSLISAFLWLIRIRVFWLNCQKEKGGKK